MAERERFARCRRGVLEALIARLADLPQRALPHGRAMVAAEPLDEAAQATLVRLLAAVGRYPEAEQHYAYARDLLRREVALPDGGTLDETIRRVRRHQRQAAIAPHPPPADHGVRGSCRARACRARSFIDLARPAAPAPPALIGRDDECRAIDDALAAPQQAPVLLLLGEPGIGKTRLLDHLAAARRRQQGLSLIRARCFEAEAVRPYGYWLDALRGLPTDGGGRDMLLAAMAPLMGGQAGAVSREQLFDAAAALLDSLAAQQPLADRRRRPAVDRRRVGRAAALRGAAACRPRRGRCCSSLRRVPARSTTTPAPGACCSRWRASAALLRLELQPLAARRGAALARATACPTHRRRCATAAATRCS